MRDLKLSFAFQKTVIRILKNEDIGTFEEFVGFARNWINADNLIIDTDIYRVLWMMYQDDIC